MTVVLTVLFVRRIRTIEITTEKTHRRARFIDETEEYRLAHVGLVDAELASFTTEQAG